MTERTRKEIKRCQDYLECPNPLDPDHATGKEGAKRGLEDWFLQSVIEEFGENFGTAQNTIQSEGVREEGK